MKRVLLTGASGFIGQQCLEELPLLGYEVHAVSRRRFSGARSHVVWHQHDLLENKPDTLLEKVRPSHLLHLAWCVTPGAYWTSPENLRWVGASLALIRAFRERGGERFVGAGTCAEYDWTGDGHLAELATERRPATLYGACKDALRRIIASYGAQTGLSYAWAHFFFMYGPMEPPGRFVSSVVAGLLGGERPRCTIGTQVRDFLHVRDVAGAITALLDSPVQGPVNIASGVPVSLRDVVRQIEVEVGMPGRTELGALPTPTDAPPRLTASTERLFSEVGWQPHYTLETGIRQTVASVRAARGTERV